jgi:hypothetical protein
MEFMSAGSLFDIVKIRNEGKQTTSPPVFGD